MLRGSARGCGIGDVACGGDLAVQCLQAAQVHAHVWVTRAGQQHVDMQTTEAQYVQVQVVKVRYVEGYVAIGNSPFRPGGSIYYARQTEANSSHTNHTKFGELNKTGYDTCQLKTAGISLTTIGGPNSHHLCAVNSTPRK